MARERSLGKRLRETRLEAGFSQSKLARSSGVPKTRLSRYENDHIVPSVGTVRKIARALGVGEGSLIGDERSGEQILLRELRERGVRIGSPAAAKKAADAVARALGRNSKR